MQNDFYRDLSKPNQTADIAQYVEEHRVEVHHDQAVFDDIIVNDEVSATASAPDPEESIPNSEELDEVKS